MQIQAYQFIKYNKNTLIEHIEKVHKSGAVICFDFEDGMSNPLEINMSASLKDDARKQFNKLYSQICNSNKDIKIGIRLNRVKSEEFCKDLNAIKGKIFNTIFIPKIECSEENQLIIDKLKEFNIDYKNLIPIIESKKGFENLENILQSNQNLSKIAFGHCDYNLSIGTYPFFHQDSWEYWKWVAVLTSTIKKHNVQLVNSAYLDFGNEAFFCSMLDYLITKENLFHGQVTLTTRQSELCNHREKNESNFKNLLENKNLISADTQVAYDLVREFEANNKLKGLTKISDKFISLQEYIASKSLISDNRNVNEMCFAGGCFPVQHNIVFENLFHQKLKQKIENAYNVKLNFNIIRYERLSTVLEKIKTLTNSKNLDLLVFHVRPEPFLRLIKLFYKYTNNQGKTKRSLNLPHFNLLNPEKYDMLDIGVNYANNKQRKHLFHKFLISCNYILGWMIGNKRYALNSYYKTVKEIIDFCDAKSIKYFILGPNRRSNNCLEPSLCKKLDLYMSSRVEKTKYINGYKNDTIKKMNQENGIHVTQIYHDLIADKLYKAIVDNNLLTLTSPSAPCST